MSVFKAVLIGRNIGYSVSPLVQEKLFPLLSTRYGSPFNSIEYSIFDCDERCDFAAWIKTASTNGYQGANVTIPFKQDAHNLAQVHVGASAALGSANTLQFGNEIRSLSTDGEGFFSALSRTYPAFNLEHYHLVSIGAGSAARAVLYALCTKWMPRSLTIVNRDRSKAEELAEFCIAQAPGPTVSIMGINEFVAEYPESHYRFVVQATPIGNTLHPGNPVAGFSWHETDIVADLNYKPLQTPLLQQAAAAGAKTLGGLGMLIEQAALAQAYWLSGSQPERSPLADEEYHQLLATVSKELLQ